LGGQLNSLRFEAPIFFPAKKANFIFSPKGQSNVGRCGEDLERVTGEHACVREGGDGISGGTPGFWKKKSNFGTVISVADNVQDDVDSEMDSE